MNNDYHIPVMLHECVDNLLVNPDGKYLDCTMGGGGHTREILKRISSKGMLVSVDRDEDAIAQNKELENQYSNFMIKHIPFSRVIELEEIAFGLKFDGILLDLGVSSYQIDKAERGFSYMKDGELDMRMNDKEGLSALDVVNDYDRDDLVRIFRDYGEEKKSGRIADSIVRVREDEPIKTTSQLKSVVEACVPGRYSLKSVARVFQAIRIEVNSELDEIRKFLNFSLEILNSGGRVGIISFHSLEDRIIKNFINEQSRGCICPKEFPVCICNNKPKVKKISKKPIIATEQEIKVNVRSRSAKLRIFEKI